MQNMSVRMYVRTYVRTHVKYMYMCIDIHTCVFTLFYKNLSVYEYVYIYILCICICT